MIKLMGDPSASFTCEVEGCKKSWAEFLGVCIDRTGSIRQQLPHRKFYADSRKSWIGVRMVQPGKNCSMSFVVSLSLEISRLLGNGIWLALLIERGWSLWGLIFLWCHITAIYSVIHHIPGLKCYGLLTLNYPCTLLIQTLSFTFGIWILDDSKPDNVIPLCQHL